MRSHAIVALFAFLAGALVVALITFVTRSQDRAPGPVEPGASTSSVSTVPQPPVDIASVPTAKPVVAEHATNGSAKPMRTPTERRTLCLLGGFVRSSSEGSRPVATAYVGLFQPALQDEGPTSPFGQWTGKAEFYPDHRQLVSWTYTDEDGKFSFDELKAGTFIVRAELGPLVSASTAPQTLEAGEVRAGLDIALPLTGALEGRILAPPETAFDTWQVALERVEKHVEDVMLIDGRPDDRIQKHVDDDGTFTLGPGQPGLHRVLLVWPGQHTRLQQMNGLPIGEVMIVAGESVKRDFDLRTGFPGSLNVTLHIPLFEREDAPAFHRRIPYTIDARPGFRDAKVESVVASCRLGETVVVGPLEPGMWSLNVVSPISQWTYTVPIEELVEAGRVHDVTIEIPLFEGTLTCLDSDSGEALRNAGVMIGVHGLEGQSSAGQVTDDLGRMHLQYPIGTCSVARYVDVDGHFDMALPETFEWREDGPHPSSVKLMAPASAPH